MNLSHTQIIITAVAVSRLKKKAKRRQRETGRPHHALLDEVAKEAGFNHWHHVTEALEYTRIAEQRFRSGLYVLMDVKEGLDLIGEDFQIDPEALPLRYQFIFDWMNSIDIDEEDDLDPLSAKEIEDAINHDYVLLRYCGEEQLPHIGNAIEWFVKHTFWLPSIIWVRGKHLFPLDGPPPVSSVGEEHLDNNEESSVDRDEPIPVIDEGLLRSAFGSPGKAQLVLNAETMERFEIFAGPRRSWYWCLHCERAYPQGSYRQLGRLQLCPYSDCDGDTVTDAWSWARIVKENPDYPEIPALETRYPLYGSARNK